MKPKYYISIIIITFLVIVVVSTVIFIQFQKSNSSSQENNQPINRISDNKFCNTNDDCWLLLCGGCFSKEFLKTAPPDLPCIQYEGYHCECIENKCGEIK